MVWRQIGFEVTSNIIFPNEKVKYTRKLHSIDMTRLCDNAIIATILRCTPLAAGYVRRRISGLLDNFHHHRLHAYRNLLLAGGKL